MKFLTTVLYIEHLWWLLLESLTYFVKKFSFISVRPNFLQHWLCKTHSICICCVKLTVTHSICCVERVVLNLWRRCFRMYFANFLRLPFLHNTFGGCFWMLEISELNGSISTKWVNWLRKNFIPFCWWQIYSIRTEKRLIIPRYTSLLQGNHN